MGLEGEEGNTTGGFAGDDGMGAACGLAPPTAEASAGDRTGILGALFAEEGAGETDSGPEVGTVVTEVDAGIEMALELMTPGRGF